MGLAVVAVVHALDLPNRMAVAPGSGLLSVGTIGAGVVAIVLLAGRDGRGWALGATTAALALGATFAGPHLVPVGMGTWAGRLGACGALAAAVVLVATGLAAAGGVLHGR